MKLNKMPVEFQQALPIIDTLKAAGFEAYFVGGSVRDVLLDRHIHDVDIATSAYPEEVKQIFEKTVDIGIEHGTVLILTEEDQYEVTTFRTEDVYVDFRRPSGVTFVRSLDEDLLRRDFTINAFALAENGEIIDKFSGLEDLKNKQIRAVGIADERFNEDALRIMRALRFTASLNFDIEAKTFEAMTNHAPLLKMISIERSFIELDKLLIADYWRKGLRNLIDSKVYDYLSGLENKRVPLESILTSLKDENFSFSSSEQAWAYLLLKIDIKECKSFLKKWNVSNEFIKSVTNIFQSYKERQKRAWEKADIYNYGYDILLQVEQLRQAEGDTVDFERIDMLEETISIHDRSELEVNGAILMKEFNRPGGIWIGEMIAVIEELVVTGDLENKQEKILEYVKDKINE